jgi:predicted DNA-binding antitoxin AbrB/MazE fold protein
MSQEFDAIYERGVFRPLGRVDLPEQTKVHLQVQQASEGAPPSSVDDEHFTQKAAMRELLAWVQSQPSSPPGDSISARDHDQILYGWQK